MLSVFCAGLAFRFLVFSLSHGSIAPAAFVEAHCVWDCRWYSSIIEHGYDAGIGLRGESERANWAFFPLYPLIVALIAKPLGLSAALAGFFVSNAFAVATALVSRPFFSGQRTYALFVATLMIGPFSVLFSSLYTESLFVLLTVLALRSLRDSHYRAAAGWTMLLSATRVTGVLMVFAIAAQVVVDHLKSGGKWRGLPARVVSDPDLLLALLAAPLGLFAFMAFLHAHTGDALAFSHIQRSWGRELEGPLSALGNVLAAGWALNYYTLLQQSWAIAALIGLALSGALLVRKRYAEAVFCLLCLLVSLSSGIGSMVRFVAGLAPLGMMAAELLGRWRPVAWVSLALAVALDAVVTLGWFNASMFVM